MKKFSAILICLLMIITCGLAGCATFSIDKVTYYNEVLATVDETKITRFDLLTAYNSYGNSYYVQQMGQSEKEALKSTLDLLIDRELMYQYALDNNSTYKPTEYQVNEIVKEIFDSMDEQMETYLEEAKKILNIEIEESSEDEETNETAYTLESYKYSPRAEVKYTVKTKPVYYTDATYTKKSSTETEFVRNEEYNDYYIEYIVPEEDVNYEKLIDETYLTDFTNKETINQIKIKYFEHLLENLTVDEGENATTLYNKVRTLFAQDLINYEYYLRDENGKKYNKSNESLFNRYFERTFESQIQSQYLENIRIKYLESEELSIDLLTQEYNYLATMSYNAYNSNHETYKNKMKNISTDGDSVLYHPETDVQFGYFVHTLIKFDSIKENLTLLENEKDPEKYKEQYNSLVASVKVKARDLETGLVPEDAEDISLSQVINEYNEIQNYSNYDEKLSAFLNFMFKYTGDTATLSAGMPYVVGTNGYSAMVEEFNNEAIKLMQGAAGNMSTASLSDIDNLCITEYGIHLLFYVGDVNSYDISYGSRITIETSPVDYIIKEYVDTNNQVQTYVETNLYNKIINPLTKETYFDMMFDLVYPASSGEVYSSNNGYTEFEENLTAKSQKTHKVTKYTTKIKATKTSL